MKWEQIKRVEQSRIRSAIEVRDAKNSNEFVGWAKVIGAIAVMVAVAVAALMVIQWGECRADEEERKTELIRETIRLNDEAVERISKRPNDGPAWLAFVVGTALLYGGK